ncbi:multidrug resistance efflux transporter family protein [Heyndrickxia sp. FSL W8-0496]|uniref:DMT family transporter n=1 Tax=Heyndrickxia TaxID=2837504 RepID=UPI0030FCAA36
MKAIILGIGAAFFFAITFVLNRSMELSGGSWLWSASLRYFFMIPFLLIIVLWRKSLKDLLREMKKHPVQWLLWSCVGFGLFYGPLCFSSAYGPGWLVAGTWQITIISGSLLVPFFSEVIQTPNGPVKVKGKIPFKGLMMSLIILIGVFCMQFNQGEDISLKSTLLVVLPVLIASFAYPLGNRKMMQICEGRLDPFQRVLGMTIASLPFWIILSVYALKTVGTPSVSQLNQSLIVAISSGVIATVLFFKATDLVKDDVSQLAAVEATQSVEILFALIGEIIILHAAFPSMFALFGIFLVIIGMILHSYISRPKDVIINEEIGA